MEVLPMKKLTRVLALTLCMAFLLSSLPSHEKPEITTYERLNEKDTNRR